MAIPSINDRQSDRKPVSSELHKIILPQFKKDIYCSLKRSNQHFLYKCTSTRYVLHNYKVSWNSLPWIKFLSSKRSITRRKKIESEFPVDMHTITLCPSLLQSLRNFCWAVSEEKQDWLTDGRVKNIILSATSWLGYNKRINQ